jgi:hypothetical protein
VEWKGETPVNKAWYRPGDIVTYRAVAGGARRVRVTETSDDLKNGWPGFHGVVVSTSGKDTAAVGTECTGYDAQIEHTEYQEPRS